MITTSERHPIDLLAEEFVTRYRRDDRPSITEYAQRHPELADEIRTIFPTIVEMEELKRGHSKDLGREAFTTMPEWLGDCRIIREVGRGGMGIVYEAEQKSLSRRVAVKVLTGAGRLTPKQ